MAVTLPESRLDEEWRLVEQVTETVFKLPTAEVVGDTHLYEDGHLRDTVREATDGVHDLPWRFFFSTDLTFRPPLAPGFGTASVFPTVVSSARREFAGDLRERGFAEVERQRSERMRLSSGSRARLNRYTAHYPLTEAAVVVEGWLAVWTAGGSFALAGGAYPVDGLDELVPSVGLSPGDYRNELLDMIKTVG
ncbi:hypothetical protein [Haloarchaeobius sp. HME9146]|uniref:hypothetical protein n=1 Tax=Haloarchaeobius sp. HME9146 TaxID=2978732 RepID=UPI0021C0875C|nr:hypothetical protein [Haloarchaeobius sp. HME9146]MCT9095712.1 hypothetical protein [Haloarchaeobius sp. HME9146]